MTSEEIARQRALCAVKGGTCPVVLNENGGPLCAAREALPAALDEIERLRVINAHLARDYNYAAVEMVRLREMIAGLGLDPDAGVAK